MKSFWSGPTLPFYTSNDIICLCLCTGGQAVVSVRVILVNYYDANIDSDDSI